MGPFLSAIVAALLTSFAVDAGPLPAHLSRWPAILGAAVLVLVARLTTHAYLVGEGEDGEPVPPNHPPWARLLDVGLFSLLLAGTDWAQVGREAVGDLPFLRHAFVFLPYWMAALARVDAAYPAEQQIADDGWGRTRNLFFHGRLLLIPILPLFVIHGLSDVLARIPFVSAFVEAYPQAVQLEGVLLVALTAAFTPWFMQWLLQSKPLDPGPLRDELEAYLARIGFRVGRIDRVDTGGRVANAAFVGVLPGLNRVFISDALLRALPPDEVRAVFAHEIGHGVHRHLWTFLLFLLSVPLLMYAALEPMTFSVMRAVKAVTGAPGIDQAAAQIASLLVVGVGMAVSVGSLAFAFIWISRRLEVEADLFAARTLDDPDLFTRALVRVGALGGKPLDHDGWRHYSIVKRVGIVREWADIPAARARWSRLLGRIRRWTLVGFVAAAVVTGMSLPRDLAVVNARRLVTELDESLRKGDLAQARSLVVRLNALRPTGDPVDASNRLHLTAELVVAEANPRDARQAVEDATHGAANLQARIDAGATAVEPTSALIVEQELLFMQAITGVTGKTPFAFDPEAFAASRILALAHGLPSGADDRAAAWRALAELEEDDGWRKAALDRAFGGRPAAEVLEQRLATGTTRKTP